MIHTGNSGTVEQRTVEYDSYREQWNCGTVELWNSEQLNMIHTGNSGTVELWNSEQLNMIHTGRATVGEVLSVQCFNPEWCKSFEGQWIAVQHRGIKYFFEISTGALLRAHLVSCVRLLPAIYPPQHKQAGLQIQRNTNRNTACNSNTEKYK